MTRFMTCFCGKDSWYTEDSRVFFLGLDSVLEAAGREQCTQEKKTVQNGAQEALDGRLRST